jgi:hypothetical protein
MTKASNQMGTQKMTLWLWMDANGNEWLPTMLMCWHCRTPSAVLAGTGLMWRCTHLLLLQLPKLLPV